MEKEMAGRSETRARGACDAKGLLRTDVQPNQEILHGTYEQIPEHVTAIYGNNKKDLIDNTCACDIQKVNNSGSFIG